MTLTSELQVCVNFSEGSWSSIARVRTRSSDFDVLILSNEVPIVPFIADEFNFDRLRPDYFISVLAPFNGLIH